jgi:hypothetical protein
VPVRWTPTRMGLDRRWGGRGYRVGWGGGTHGGGGLGVRHGGGSDGGAEM